MEFPQKFKRNRFSFEFPKVFLSLIIFRLVCCSSPRLSYIHIDPYNFPPFKYLRDFCHTFCLRYSSSHSFSTSPSIIVLTSQRILSIKSRILFHNCHSSVTPYNTPSFVILSTHGELNVLRKRCNSETSPAYVLYYKIMCRSTRMFGYKKRKNANNVVLCVTNHRPMSTNFSYLRRIIRNTRSCEFRFHFLIVITE